MNHEQIIDKISQLDAPEWGDLVTALGYNPETVLSYERQLNGALDRSLSRLSGYNARGGNSRSYNAVYQPPFQHRDATLKHIIERILAHVTVTEDGQRLVLIFSDHPNSGAFDHLQDDHLYLFVSPRNTAVTAAPGSDWEEIAGGWKKGNRLFSRVPICLSTNGAGRIIASAARPQQQIEMIRTLVSGNWPETIAAEEREQIQQVLSDCELAGEISEQAEQAITNHLGDVSSAERTVQAAASNADYYRSRASDLQRQVTELEREAQGAELARTVAQEELDTYNAQTPSKRTLSFKQAGAVQKQLELIKNLDHVVDALVPPSRFGSGLTFHVSTDLLGGALEFDINSDGISFHDSDTDLGTFGLERRALALSEKIGRLEVADVAAAICQAVSSD